MTRRNSFEKLLSSLAFKPLQTTPITTFLTGVPPPRDRTGGRVCARVHVHNEKTFDIGEKSLPKMSMTKFLESVTMLSSMEKGTLQIVTKLKFFRN